MAMVAGAANGLGGPGAAERMNLPSHADFYGIASIILFVFARGRRAGAAVPRPARGHDQPLPRAAADRFGLHRLAVGRVPGRDARRGVAAAGHPVPRLSAGAIRRRSRTCRTHWLDVPQFLPPALAMAAYARRWPCSRPRSRRGEPTRRCSWSGCSSSRRRSPIGLAEEIGGTAGQWISMFNLTNIPRARERRDLRRGRARSRKTRPRASCRRRSSCAGTSPGRSCRARCCGGATGGSRHERTALDSRSIRVRRRLALVRQRRRRERHHLRRHARHHRPARA